MYRLIEKCNLNVRRFNSKISIIRTYSTNVNVEKGWLRAVKRRPSRCRRFSNCGILELGVAYAPQAIEEGFLDNNYFRSENKKAKFILLLPPPNITGNLHLGHALAVTLQDVLVKWHKMRGFETVWIPGIDHAGIATQVIVEKRLWKQRRLSRYDLGRQEFEKEVWKWKDDKAEVIGQQLRRIGASLDWTRQIFTMDLAQSSAVTEAFIKLYECGLIYRSDYLVNWSCALRSAISDIEVEHLEVNEPTEIVVPGYTAPVQFGRLTRFAYKLCDAPSTEVDEIIVATTRPETMIGDVAVAVNPKDTRYLSLIGRTLWHPFRNEGIPVIADEYVDPNFGTGAVKVTPAHDHNDFDVAKRHQLNLMHVINEDGNLSTSCGKFSGLRRFHARSILVDELNKLNLLRGTENHRMIVPICSRSKDVVEFLCKPQWFVRCRGMANRAMEDYRTGKLTIEPEKFGKNWINWLENIRDWCVSRQLWWGHRVPVYFCRGPGKESTRQLCIAARSLEEARSKAAAEHACPPDKIDVVQDEDVLDTWFSSAILPFSVLGWPRQTEDFKDYYPLSVMETGHDILFFWVARMVMLGTQLTGKLPFSKILLHGIVCDAHGRKMSKSLGNVVAPEDVIFGRTLKDLADVCKQNHAAGILTAEELQKAVIGQKKMFPEGIPECGADALRFTLCSHNIKNHFINFDVQECKINKFFGNKIWQAVKFSNKWIQAVLNAQEIKEIKYELLDKMDKWILSRLSFTVRTVIESLEKYEFHNATSALKNFMYYDFCDIYLEAAKRGLRSTDSERAAQHCWTIRICLDVGLRCLAPFMPRLTQHLHERLLYFPFTPRHFDFPQEDMGSRNTAIEADVEKIMEVVVSIRRLKKLFNVTGKHKPRVILESCSPMYKEFMEVIQDLSGCDTIMVVDKIKSSFNSAVDVVSDKVVGGNVTVHLSVPAEMRRAFEVDLQKLDEKKIKLVVELEKIRRIISEEAYMLKAPNRTQEANLKKIAALEEKISRIDYMHTLTKS